VAARDELLRYLWDNVAVYALIRAVGVGSPASFQAWFVSGFALTYVAAFVNLRKLGLRTWGAAAGAFLFTSIADQSITPQLIYLWVPPAVLAFDRFLRVRKPTSRSRVYAVLGPPTSGQYLSRALALPPARLLKRADRIVVETLELYGLLGYASR
jgi:hypothetical protein